ncbi:MAG: hypothetical protein PVI66_01125 [Candidatus Aminicenantes bacterium]
MILGRKMFLFVIVVLFTLTTCHIQEAQKRDSVFFPLKGPYLGQNPPGMIPEIFAPGIISTEHSERIAAFTPDGKELFYALWGAPHGVILHLREVNGHWTKPEVAPFSGCYQGEFTMSSDGNTIMFSSNSPFTKRGKPQDDYYCWIVKRTENGWGEPKPFGPLINSTESFAGYPTIAENGNLYFFSDRAGGKGNDDIWMSECIEGLYTEPVNLGDAINTVGFDVDPFIAPDESYIIFARIDKERKGNFDLFISFKKKDGTWTRAENMGDKINSNGSEYCPTVSPDEKYFFFTSNRSIHESFSEIPLTYEGKLKILNSPGNGSSDIYWMDAKLIEELKLDALKEGEDQ